MLLDSPYRPHNSGWDYYEPGTYLITLVVAGREPLLSTLGTDPRHPEAIPTPLGSAVLEAWRETEQIQRAKGRAITLLAGSAMPDHFHGVIRVESRIDCHLGEIIRCFKIACTQAKRRLYSSQPCMVASDKDADAEQHLLPGDVEYLGKKLRNMSPLQRSAYEQTLAPTAAPLFDANYDDSIALREGQEEAMIHYVLDNPRRAILRRAYPQLFEKRLHIEIAGQDYAAYGNLFLLKWGWKVPVKCHRWRMVGNQRDYDTPYEQSAAFEHQLDELKRQAAGGALLITPAVSRGEQIVRNMCLDQHIPLILLQKEPIEPYWKPEQRRFDACAEGLLLILAPWQLEDLGTATRTYADGTTEEVPADTDYSRFHNMNNLAIELSRFTGEAKIKR